MNDKLINQEMEACVLGTIIMNNVYLNAVEDFLEPKHFAYIDHARIYEHILNTGNVVNQITLKNLFVDLPCGVEYISILLGQASTIVSIKDYAMILIELWQKESLSIS